MDFVTALVDVEKITETLLTVGGKVLLALVVFFVGKWIIEKVVLFADKLLARSPLDNAVAKFLSNMLYGVLLVFVALAALNKMGFNTSSAVAILGGAAVAIGISLKDQISNISAGIIIVLFRPFSYGDTIEINGTKGVVQDITLVHTRLMTVNNDEVIIPNGNITTNQLINYTSLPNRRVDIVVGIGYGDDIKTAKEILIQTAKKHELVLATPEPIVRVTNLGDSSVDLTLNVWTLNADWWVANCDLLEDIKYALDAANIEIPFPQRSLHIEGLDNIIEKVSNIQSDKHSHQP